MKILRLPLKMKWFEMTKNGIKKEDYREITPYWCSRFLTQNYEMERSVWLEMVSDLSNKNRRHSSVEECLSFFNVKFRHFDANFMTLGYPKGNDTERIVRFEHKGIEIREGKEEWGAERGRLYFAIKHGELIIK